jgi:hypothetical protein
MLGGDIPLLQNSLPVFDVSAGPESNAKDNYY